VTQRLTDCNKWRDPWFQNLTTTLKLLWLYIEDNSDQACVWVVNQRLAEFEMGISDVMRDAEEAYSDRIRLLPGGKKWFLESLFRFRFPTGLQLGSNAHQAALRLLAFHHIPSSWYEVGGGGRVPEGLDDPSGTAHTTPPPTTIPSSKGGVGGAVAPAKLRTDDLLAEFGLRNNPKAVKEWAHGLSRIAKCGSLDEARCFLRWAIARCREEGASAEYWRHVKVLAENWNDYKREELWERQAAS